MIKKLNNITIGDYAEMEATGRISQFKMWYNILPAILFSKQIQSLVNEITKKLSDKKIEDEEEVNKYKLKSLDKINKLEVNLQLLYLILINQTLLKQITEQAKSKVKIKDIDIKVLKESIKEIETISGISVDEKDINGKMKEIRAEIEFLKDKYFENFVPKKSDVREQKKVSINYYAGTYVSYMGGDIKGLSKMLIIDLLTVKELADDKYKKEQEQINKLKNV